MAVMTAPSPSVVGGAVEATAEAIGTDAIARIITKTPIEASIARVATDQPAKAVAIERHLSRAAAGQRAKAVAIAQ
jgi:hypothetical protein